MRDMVKLGIRLLIFTVVAGLLLALTNMVTSGPIERQKMEQANASRKIVFPDAADFEAMTIENADEYPEVTELFKATDENKTEVGYAFSLAPSGYNGKIALTLGVNAQGAVTQLVVDSQNETAGIGSKVAEQPFLGQFSGIAADPSSLENSVDTITGATVSSNAVLSGVKQALSYATQELGLSPNADPSLVQSAPLSEEEQALADALPGADAFKPIAPFALLGDYDTISALTQANKGAEIAGYIFEAQPKGYSGEPVKMQIAIDGAGKIASLSVLGHNDTPGIGTMAAESPEFIQSFVGKDADPETISGIDAVSGATVTSGAMKKGVSQAAAFYLDQLSEDRAGQSDSGEPQAQAGPFPEGAEFTDITGQIPEGFKGIAQVEEVSAEGSAAGYVVTSEATGYNADNPIKLKTTLDAQGTILSVEVLSMDETPGIGDRAAQPEFLSAFEDIGVDTDASSEVQVLSGATLSSKAVIGAVAQAQKLYQEIVGSASAQEAPDAVEAANQEASDSADASGEEVDISALNLGEDVLGVQKTEGGYTVLVAQTGFNAESPMQVSVALDAAGTVLSAEVVFIDETPGIGDRTTAPEFTDLFKGIEIGTSPADKVQVLSGATLSSKAVIGAVAKAQSVFQALNGGAQDAADAAQEAPDAAEPANQEAPDSADASGEEVDISALNLGEDVLSVQKTEGGYTVLVAQAGFNAESPMQVSVALDAAGAVLSAEVVFIDETPGIGDRTTAPEFTDLFKGIEIGTSPADKVQVLSGATLSSKAVIGAVTKAQSVFQALNGGAEDAADTETEIPDAVQDAQPEDASSDAESAQAAQLDFAQITYEPAEVTLPEGFEGVEKLSKLMLNGEVAGYAVETTKEGLKSQIVLETAFDTQGNVVRVQVLSEDETPDRGGRIVEEEFIGQFAGQSSAGEIKADTISGATISSTAVLESVRLAALAYQTVLAQ